MIENGELGKILAVKGTNRGRMPGGWFTNKKLSGGGAVIDHTVHVVDLIRWFLRKEVKKVYAEIDNTINHTKIDDCGTIMMEFDDGIFGSLDPSWSRPKTFPVWGDVSLDIIGEKGVISVDAFSQGIGVYNDNKNEYKWEHWGTDCNTKLLKNFADTIFHNRMPFITGYDGLKSLEVAQAAYESAAKKKSVTLPLNPPSPKR